MAYTPYRLESLGACCAACARGAQCSSLGDVDVKKVGLLVLGVAVAAILFRKKSR
jgi:hypothetical protein